MIVINGLLIITYVGTMNNELEELIEFLKRKLEYRAINAGVFDKKTTKIFHVEANGFIYVIVNSLLTDYDNDLRPFQRYNLSYWYKDYVTDGGKYMLSSGMNLILMPYLIARIDLKDNNFIDGHDFDLGRAFELNDSSWIAGICDFGEGEFVGLDWLVSHGYIGQSMPPMDSIV